MTQQAPRPCSTTFYYFLSQLSFVLTLVTSRIYSILVGNPNRKKMHIYGFVGIFEYICKTTFNIIFSMYTKP